MEQRLVPEFFYGSAIAALCGLTAGLMLHAGWKHHPGGPQILFSAAEAAEPHNPVADDSPSPPAAPVQTADLGVGYAPPTPLPVVRLRPDMFEVQPAAADEAQRADVDDLLAEPAPPAPPRDLD